MTLIKRTGKKVLSLLLAVLMVISTVAVAGNVMLISADAAITVSGSTPTFTFYVPETIYLRPGNNYALDYKTFQYYVNRAQSVGGALSNTQDTTGNIYFYCNGATAVSGLACTGATVSLSATSASSGTLSATLNSGSLASAQTQNTTSRITWTVNFTYNGQTYTATNYTTVYAPNRNVTANGVYGFDYNSKESCSSGLLWIEGANSTGTATYSDTDSSSSGRGTLYQNITGTTFDPLVTGVSYKKEARPSDWGTTTSPFTAATNSFLSCNCVKSDNRDGNGDWVIHHDCNRTSAEVTVDTSRYTNLNQIPNLKLGYYVTDWANSNSRRNAWVSDATSAVTWSGSTYSLTAGGKDITKHAYWRDDDIANSIFSSGYGTLLYNASGASTPGSGGDNTGTNLSGLRNFPSGGDDEGLKYYSAISCSTSALGTNNTRFFRGCCSGSKSSSYAMSCAMVSLKVNTVDKSTLRSTYNTCVGTYMSGYYTDSTWNTYNSALQTAADALGNPASDATQIANANTSLTNAKNALVLKTGTATVTHKTASGTTLGTDTKTYNYGQTVTAAANSYTGYTYSSASPTTLTYNNVKDVAKAWTLTYNPITYTVAYNGNGSTSGSTASSSHTYDVAKALTTNGFTRKFTVTYNANSGTCETSSADANATFNGWATT